MQKPSLYITEKWTQIKFEVKQIVVFLFIPKKRATLILICTSLIFFFFLISLNFYLFKIKRYVPPYAGFKFFLFICIMCSFFLLQNDSTLVYSAHGDFFRIFVRWNMLHNFSSYFLQTSSELSLY